MGKVILTIKKKPILFSVFFSLGIGGMISILNIFINYAGYLRLDDILVTWILWGVFIIYPIILTLINLVSLILKTKDNIWKKSAKKFEYITLILGFLYSVLCLLISNIIFHAEWSEVLYNNEIHSPIWPESFPTLLVLCSFGVVGYSILSWVKLEKLPPLVIVTAMAFLYMGVFECIMWCVQIFKIEYIYLCLLPFNYVIIAMKIIRYKIGEWNEMEEHRSNSYFKYPVLNFFNNKLQNATYWPLAAFVIMWPLLGIIFCLLALFGQKPDYFIKTWTETADWRLSQRTAPPNLFRDEHYLCTVAAGGHRRIVKPLRMGERHGHRVLVNRQLCVANAFEQILEERLPHFHKQVRRFYDKFGFPLAKTIRTKMGCDVVYILMKPLEWIFLVVIYFCDAKPENRIAVQYMPKKAE